MILQNKLYIHTSPLAPTLAAKVRGIVVGGGTFSPAEGPRWGGKVDLWKVPWALPVRMMAGDRRRPLAGLRRARSVPPCVTEGRTNAELEKRIGTSLSGPPPPLPET